MALVGPVGGGTRVVGGGGGQGAGAGARLGAWESYLLPTSAYYAPNIRILCIQPFHRQAPNICIDAPNRFRKDAPNICIDAPNRFRIHAFNSA